MCSNIFRKYKPAKSLIVLLSLLFCPQLLAGEIDLHDTIDVNLTEHGAVYLDPTSEMGIDEILRMPEGNWEKSKRSSYGLTSDTVWKRISLDSASDRNWYIINKYSTIDTIEVYKVDKEDKTFLGDFGLFSKIKRKISSRYTVVSIGDVKPGDTYYIKARSETPIILRLHLVSDNGLINTSQTETLLLLICFGAFIGLFLYNIVLFCLIREQSYFWYCSYLFSFGVTWTYITGVKFQYLGLIWSSNELGLGLEKPGGPMIIFIALSIISMVNFCRYFIGTKKLYPRIDRAFFWINILICFLALPKLIIRDNAISLWLFPIQSILLWVLLGLAIHSYYKGVRAALYYVVGWSAIAVGMTIYTWSSRGYIETPNFFEMYAGLFTALFEMILLSIAVGAKFISILSDRLLSEKRQKVELENKNKELLEAHERSDRGNVLTNRKIRTITKSLRDSIKALEIPLKMVAKSNLGGMDAKLVETGISNIQSISKYADDLELYSFLQSERLDLNYQQTDLVTACSSVIDRYKGDAARGSIDLSFEHKGLNLPTMIYIDEVRVRQILSTLIDNALRFTEHGSVHVHLTALPCDLGDDSLEVTIRVRDTGVGITLESDDYTTLFDGTYQATNKYAVRQKGAGLGLHISKKIAQSHKGSLSYTPEENGSSFTFRFVAQLTDKSLSENDSQQKFKKVLAKQLMFVGEKYDKESSLWFIQQEAGFDVRAAKTASHALEICKSENPSYVFIDHLIDVDAQEGIITKISNLPKNQQPNRIVVARWWSSTNALGENPLVRYIKVPFNIEELLNVITAESVKSVSTTPNNIVTLKIPEKS